MAPRRISCEPDALLGGDPRPGQTHGVAVSVRPATREDIAGVTKAYLDSWRGAYRRLLPDGVIETQVALREGYDWAAAISASDSEVSGAQEEDGAVVGVVQAVEAPGRERDLPEIAMLYVMRRRGGRAPRGLSSSPDRGGSRAADIGRRACASSTPRRGHAASTSGRDGSPTPPFPPRTTASSHSCTTDVASDGRRTRRQSHRGAPLPTLGRWPPAPSRLRSMTFGGLAPR